MSDFITASVEYRAAPKVRIGIVFRCFCGRTMRQMRGDDKGWYCRKHGLQAYETN